MRLLDPSVCLRLNCSYQSRDVILVYGTCVLLSACCSQDLGGSVLYGLRIPLGSNMALKRCIRKIASLGLLY